MNKATISALAAAVVLTGAATLAPAINAQVATPPAQTQTPAPQRTHRLPSERIEARLAYLKTALKITPAQEAQWTALAGVLRAHAKAMDTEMQVRRAAREQSANQRPTAIERLEQRQKLLSTAAVRMDEVLAAAKPLYATFSDDQKQTADGLFNRHGHRFGHGRWR